jgi:ABC-type branched-subunit amino acid transport system ATPase component
MSALMQARGVTVRFGGILAVDNVDLAVYPGEVLSIIGPNGAGKTTLLNVLSGLQHPYQGRLVFRDVNVTGASAISLARAGLARTFQTIRLFAGLSVLDHVLAGQHAHLHAGLLDALLRTPRLLREEAQARDQARTILQRVGLVEVASAVATTLSYGDQRRVELARCLALTPRLLLLDEPAAGMNAVETAALAELIRSIRDGGCTVVLIEHDMRLVMTISDRVVVLDRGQVLAEGAPAAIQNNPNVIAAYLGSAAQIPAGLPVEAR